MENDSGSKLEATSEPPPSADEEAHDEWLIDESIEETFPASDPTLPVQPGSSVARRHRAKPGTG